MASTRPMPRGASETTQLAAAASLVGNAFVSSANAATSETQTSSTVPLRISTSASGQGAPMAAPRPLPRPGGEWAVQLGAYRDADFAESVLTDALVGVTEPLVGAHRSVGQTVVNGVPLYAATFIGLSENQATATCSSLHAQDRICRMVRPNG